MRFMPQVCHARSPSSGVARAAEAGEDLPPLRVVPVAERVADHAEARRPRAAAEHLVLVAEEELGVLAVRVRPKARVRAEVARRPLPRVADHAEDAVGRLTLGIRPRRGRAETGLVEVRAL